MQTATEALAQFSEECNMGQEARALRDAPREFVSGIAPLNGWNFFRRDKEAATQSGLVAVDLKGEDQRSVYGTCVAASKDSPVAPGVRALIAYRNVREVWHNGEKVCVIKSEDILAVCEE